MSDETMPAEVFSDNPIGFTEWAAIVDGQGDKIPWRIDSESAAAWAMAKLADCESAIGEREAQAAEWRRGIDAWLKRQTKVDERFAAFLRERLLLWGEQQRAEHPKRGTFELPNGRVRTQRRAAVLEIEDSEALIGWLKEHLPVEADEIVKTVEKVGVADVRRLGFELSGQVVESEVLLACGHAVFVGGPTEVGESAACDQCDEDETGDPLRPIEEVLTERTESLVKYNGEPVPGTRVNPEHLLIVVEPAK